MDRMLIAEAERRIRERLRQTPIIDAVVGDRPVTFKLEYLQVSGSFKARGAFNRLLANPVPAAGVVAASGGNHGVAVAYAARELNHPAHIFVPVIAAPAKVERLRALGANLHIVGKVYAEALATAEAFIAETGALSVHAYDQVETLAGQGTLALELERQAPALDTVLVAVGGGGLIGGVAAWYAGRTRIIGVEPARCPTLHAALAAGEPVDVAVGGVAADSLGATRCGTLMFPIARRYVERVCLVDDHAIVTAQRWLWDELRIAAEPGGATALAALLAGAYAPTPAERIGVIVCGANLSLGDGPNARS